MATSIDLNEKLLSKAMRLANLETKEEAINLALQEFVDRREQLKVIDLFGTVDFDESYHYKQQRTVQ